ncbi:MAG: antibiotic biosynthesis monooxygenase [Alphaproteobacteria bacterium]|nr:antibiotic biosynthesis monooxygenase [Alphaproteobacteria bacterium]MBL6939991.1 antibiotic biosynthesis monooxygenase [Alphaproteobacteria bacterium]MBL7098153.1 antibiotic biosynthesis monooxygenase [Alphaproteobacteria bacterium]
MCITYLIRFRVRSQQRETFLALLDAVLDAMRHEPTFRDAALHRDPQDPDRFMLCETWTSHEDVLEVQLHRPYRAAWHAALPELLQEPRDITIWQRQRLDRHCA